jgi:hypothetical protein
MLKTLDISADSQFNRLGLWILNIRILTAVQLDTSTELYCHLPTCSLPDLLDSQLGKVYKKANLEKGT